MRRVYVVIELKEAADFDPENVDHLDELAEDALSLVSGAANAVAYTSAENIIADEAEEKLMLAPRRPAKA